MQHSNSGLQTKGSYTRRGLQTLGDCRPRDHESVRHAGQAGGVVHPPQLGSAGGDRVQGRDAGRGAGYARVLRYLRVRQALGWLLHYRSEGDDPAHLSAEAARAQ